MWNNADIDNTYPRLFTAKHYILQHTTKQQNINDRTLSTDSYRKGQVKQSSLVATKFCEKQTTRMRLHKEITNYWKNSDTPLKITKGVNAFRYGLICMMDIINTLYPLCTFSLRLSVWVCEPIITILLGSFSSLFLYVLYDSEFPAIDFSASFINKINGESLLASNTVYK